MHYFVFVFYFYISPYLFFFFPPFSFPFRLVTLAADNLANGVTSIDVGDQHDVRIFLNPPVNGLWVTPTANGLVFDPPTIWIPAGHSYAHASYTAVSPGLAQVRFAVSGPDSLLYNVNQPGGTIRVTQLFLQASTYLEEDCGNITILIYFFLSL